MANSSYRVCAVFTLKDVEAKDKFVAFVAGENGLVVARGWKGCKSIEMYESREDSNKIVIWQEWESKEDQESYIAFRHEDGTFEMIKSLVASPPEITPIRSLVMKTDEQQVEDVIRDMCNKDHTVGMKHMSDDCVFVRPSGNPLDKAGWDAMMNNADVSVTSNELVGINKLKIVGDVAYVCYTTHGVFNYKGTENDDVAVLTSVLQKVDGSWKVVHGQRSTGRSPSEEAPKFA